MRQMNQDNKGMSLVELLVSVAVLSILMAGVFGLMKAAATYHATSSREVELQNQMQTTFVQVSNLLVDADAVQFSGNRLVACRDNEFYVVEKDGNKLYAYEGTGASDSDYLLQTTKEEKLAYAMNKTISKTDNCMISDKISHFEVVTTDYEKTGYVVVGIKCEYNSRNAYMSRNVFLRNTSGTIVSNAGGTGGGSTPGAGGTSTPAPTETPSGGDPGTTPTATPTVPYNTPTPTPTTAPATPTPTTAGGGAADPISYTNANAGGFSVSMTGTEWWGGNGCNVNISLTSLTGSSSATTIVIYFDRSVTAVNCWFGDTVISGNTVTITPYSWFWSNPNGGFSLTGIEGTQVSGVAVN